MTVQCLVLKRRTLNTVLFPGLPSCGWPQSNTTLSAAPGQVLVPFLGLFTGNITTDANFTLSGDPFGAFSIVAVSSPTRRNRRQTSLVAPGVLWVVSTCIYFVCVCFLLASRCYIILVPFLVFSLLFCLRGCYFYFFVYFCSWNSYCSSLRSVN